MGWVRGARRSPLGEFSALAWTAPTYELDTPPAALVAPNGCKGRKARISKYGGRQTLIHGEVTKKTTIAIGVDVGKANLDVSVSEEPAVQFAITKPGITRLLKYLRKHDDTLVVCEATGGYEQELVSRLRESGVATHVAHPTRARAFAKACGYEAKTDPRGRTSLIPLRTSLPRCEDN